MGQSISCEKDEAERVLGNPETPSYEKYEGVDYARESMLFTV